MLDKELNDLIQAALDQWWEIGPAIWEENRPEYDEGGYLIEQVQV